MTGIRHRWSFDEAFSSYVVQGLDADGDGAYSRGELQPLAKENVESLVEFEYFTFGTLNGAQMRFGAPRDYHLEYDGRTLTLVFTLPMATAEPVRNAVFEIYDPSYYVEFSFSGGVTLAGGAPSGCASTVRTPPPLDEAAQQRLAEAEVFALTSDFSAQFANRAIIACP